MTDIISNTQILKKTLLSLKRPGRRILNLFGIRRTSATCNAFATHLPVLVGMARLFRIKRVIELGCGKFSTLTFLDRDAFPHLETLHSFETDILWADQITEIVKEDSRVIVTNVSKPMSLAVKDIQLQNYDLVFIDDSLTYEERAETIRSVASQCSTTNLILIHDYECQSYQEAAGSFTNRFSFTALVPHTGLVWNRVPLEVSKLRMLNRLIKRHARRIPPEDISSWICLVQEALDEMTGIDLSEQALK